MTEQPHGNWGEVEDLKWDRDPEELPGREPRIPADSLMNAPEIGWETPKEDIDAFTGRKVEPIEESAPERARLDAERKRVYEEHHTKGPESLDDIAA